MRIKKLQKFFALSLVIPVLFASGCTSSSTTVKQKSLHYNVSGFQHYTDGPTHIFVRPGAPTFADYSSFMVDPVRIDYSTTNALPSKESLHIRQYLRDAIMNELRDGGYRVVTMAEASTLRISPIITGVKVPNALPNAVGLLAPIALSVGEVTVETSFLQGASGRVDAVAIDRSKGSHVLNASPWSTMSDVESAFDNWAEGIRKAVDEAHAR